MNELVKYQNQMNTVPFRNFNKRDMNIFFAIVSRMRDKGDRKVTFNFRTLERLSDIDYVGHVGRFYRDLKDTYHKMQSLTVYYSDKRKFISWVLFTMFEIDKSNKTCTVKVNPDLIGILNNLTQKFTRFSLVEFNMLNSSYSKNIFRIIKQFRTTGYVRLTKTNFRTILCVPKSYRNVDIKRRIITKSLVELSPIIAQLNIKSVRKGRKIIGYEITFTPEAHKQDDFHKADLLAMPWMVQNIKQNKHLSQSLKNRAVSELYRKPIFRQQKAIPMKEFNQRLKKETVQQMKNSLKLFYYHEKKYTEYQVRKLKKAIKARETTVK